ncbi:MAG TPA: four helix bundle protein [Candidatus Pacearchaeota archaeon]|nr:four helix bundle protein [Candidatus Pacearchaeota archaeon]
MRDFKGLEIWKIARGLSKMVYVFTRDFPDDEIYGLTSQIRRAVVSVSSNIAEGCGRRTNKELIYFLHNAMGSLKEVESQVFLALDLGYLREEEVSKIEEEIDKLGKKLNVFIQCIERLDK